MTGNALDALLPKSQRYSTHQLKMLIHTKCCWPYLSVVVFALTAFCVSPSALAAQDATNCKGPGDIERDIASHPSASAYDALGAYFGRQNQFSCAISAFESALRLDPNSWGSHYNLAITLLTEGNAERAVRELRTASRLKPGMPQIHSALGAALSRLNQTGAAIEEFKTVLKTDSKSIPALDGIAKALVAEKKYAEAIAYLKDAPPEEVLQLDLAIAYSGNGNTDGAIQILSTLLEKDPSYAQARLNLGLILAGESRFTEAEQNLRKVVELNPDNTAALTALAMVLTRLKRNSEAIECFRKVTDLDPKSPGAHLNLGIALADQFDLNGALAEFSEAVRLDLAGSVAHYNKGRVLFDLQRSEEAKAELDTSVRLDPNSAGSWYLLGLIERQGGNTDQSIQHFEKAIALNPGNPEAHYMLGQEMLHKGDAVGAIAEWRKTIEIQPQYNEALYNLARLLLKTDPAEAKQLQARFENLQAEQHIADRAQTLGNFALASAGAHDWPQAISQLKEALEVCRDCSALPLLHKDLGLIYCRSGDLRNGRAELLEAQKLSPNDEDIKKSLQLLQSH